MFRAWQSWTAPGVLALLAGLFYLWIVQSLPLRIFADASHDDALFVKLAAFQLNGSWLGPYNVLTLIKGPMYALWIAWNWLVGFPLLTGQAILYLLACAWLSWQSRAWFRSPWPALCLFGVLLFNPVAFSSALLRACREGLYVSEILFMVALVVSLLALEGPQAGKTRTRSIALGMTIAFVWMTREEGVWILPGLACAWLGAVCLRLPREGLRLALRRLAMITLVVAVSALIPIHMVRLMNWFHYGVAEVTEVKHANFVAAFSALSRIQPVSWRRHVVVSSDMLAKAAQVSPTFRQIYAHWSGERWAATGCEAYQIKPCDGEIRTGWFIWAFREATAAAGFHASAPQAMAVYAAVAREIDAACEAGSLSCLPPRASLAPPFRTSYLLETLQEFARAWWQVIRFADLDIHPRQSTGQLYYREFFADLTRSLSFPAHARLVIHGEVQPQTPSPIRLAVETPGQILHESALRLVPASEANGQALAFELHTDCRIPGCVAIFASRDFEYRVPIEDFVQGRQLDFPQLTLTVKKTFDSDSLTFLPSQARARLLMKLLSFFSILYRYTVPVLFVVGVVAWLWNLVHILRQRRLEVPFVLHSVVLALVTGRLLLLAFIEVSAMPAVHVLYLSPVYPLVLLFAVVSGMQVVQALRQSPTRRLKRA
jgi:hypothetical protein